MFASASPPPEEDFFANIMNSNNIECIIPTVELLISFRTNGLQTKKLCLLYAEKMDFKGYIQLRLTEKCDQRRMYITTVDSSSFQELKQDQSLHVTFAGFMENLVKILQECQAGKLEMQLVQQATSNNVASEYKLQFVEMRAFKNLVHLSLPCRLAPLHIVLFYMNSILDNLQNKALTQDRTIQQQQHEINTQIRRAEQMGEENARLRENLLENTHTLNQRHAEEIQQMQESLRKVSEQRHSDNDRNRKTLSTMQSQLDRLVAEKTGLQTEKLQEQKRLEALKEELAGSKANSLHLKEQTDKLHAEISVLRNTERKNDMHLIDARKQTAELQEKINKFDKMKADMVAELEAEKKISQTKRQALEMATEEISKANEIILKQSQELVKLRTTISWRTEIALQQERAINEKELVLKMCGDELKELRETVSQLRNEIPKELESLRKLSNSLEQKYKEKIQDLNDQLKPLEKENKPPNANGFLTLNRRK